MSAAPQALQQDIQAATESAEQRQAALDAQRQQSASSQQAEMAPKEQAVSQQLDSLQQLKPPPKADLPTYQPKPLVDPKEYQQVSFGLLAMAMIAGIASRGNWMGVNASLNGALKGFLEGNQQRAAKDYQDYKTKFDEAKAKSEGEQKEFAQILENRKLSINEMLTQIKITAAKYGRDDIRMEAEQKSIDGIWKRVETMDQTIYKTQEQNIRFQEALAAKLAAAKTAAGGGGNPEDLQGAIGMATTGAPLNQIVPGYGKAASTQRAAVRDGAIKQIQSENPGMTLSQAGQLYAKRQVEYAGGKASVTQLTKMVGATRQAVEQLDFNVDKATEEMRKLGSTDISPVINAIIRQEEKWSGDPALGGLFYFMNAAATESARLLSGGQASAAQLHQGAAEEAKQWANVNLTPATWAEVSKSMKEEGRYRLKTYEDAIGAAEGDLGGGSKGAIPLDEYLKSQGY